MLKTTCETSVTTGENKHFHLFLNIFLYNLNYVSNSHLAEVTASIITEHNTIKKQNCRNLPEC